MKLPALPPDLGREWMAKHVTRCAGPPAGTAARAPGVNAFEETHEPRPDGIRRLIRCSKCGATWFRIYPPEPDPREEPTP